MAKSASSAKSASPPKPRQISQDPPPREMAKAPAVGKTNAASLDAIFDGRAITMGRAVAGRAVVAGDVPVASGHPVLVHFVPCLPVCMARFVHGAGTPIPPSSLRDQVVPSLHGRP